MSSIRLARLRWTRLGQGRARRRALLTITHAAFRSSRPCAPAPVSSPPPWRTVLLLPSLVDLPRRAWWILWTACPRDRPPALGSLLVRRQPRQLRRPHRRPDPPGRTAEESLHSRGRGSLWSSLSSRWKRRPRRGRRTEVVSSVVPVSTTAATTRTSCQRQTQKSRSFWLWRPRPTWCPMGGRRRRRGSELGRPDWELKLTSRAHPPRAHSHRQSHTYVHDRVVLCTAHGTDQLPLAITCSCRPRLSSLHQYRRPLPRARRPPPPTRSRQLHPPARRPHDTTRHPQ